MGNKHHCRQMMIMILKCLWKRGIWKKRFLPRGVFTKYNFYYKHFVQRAVGWRCSFLSSDGRSENEVTESKVTSKLTKNQKRLETFFNQIWIYWILRFKLYSSKSFFDRPFFPSDAYERAEEACVCFFTK